MREHEINKLNFFVKGWYIEDDLLCDAIINDYEKNYDLHRKGETVDSAGKKTVNISVKNSIDCKFADTDLEEIYVNDVVWKTFDNYGKIFSYAREDPLCINESINIQKYPIKNGGFPLWHSEIGPNGNCIFRKFVFMFYLNDIKNGGETEFLYQNLKIKPEKGLALIFPADWTYTHKGNFCPEEEKIIVTGWISYINNNRDAELSGL